MELDRRSNKFLNTIGAMIFVAICLNIWVHKEMNRIMENPRYKNTPIKGVQSTNNNKVFANVDNAFRKMRDDPSRKFSQSIIFVDGVEVARYKSVHDKVYDLEGNIPDGKVKFKNESRNTYGTEHYYNNLRHGTYTEHYKTGEVRRITKYYKGEKMVNQVFFIDGVLRIDEDFSDARRFTNVDEVGEGKIFFRDGTLQYEWYFTNSSDIGYNRSYNQYGELTAENYFDEEGNKIENY